MALIVNMKMPKSCTGCCLMGSPNCPYKGDCHVRIEEHYDCAIIGEIPDKHGRLIDADALINKVLNDEQPQYGSMVKMIQNAPTVIEANTEDKE